jgi:hypothetical protein
MDSNEEAFRGLVDAVFAHPSTKPHIPTSTREVQLEAEINRFKIEVRELIYRLEAILNAFEARHELGWVETDDSAESPF